MMEITTKIGCKLNCKFCPQEVLRRSYCNFSYETIMSLDTFKKCLDKIPAEIDIHFSGMCEPWQNSECTNMVKYAYNKGHKLYIYTTLVGMKISDYEYLKTIKIEKFVLHIPDMEGNSKFDLDDEYLRLLNIIIQDVMDDKFRIDTFSCHGSVHCLIEKAIRQVNIPIISKMFNRAGNLDVECDIMSETIKEGNIICRWCKGNSLDKNVLLPNGSVVICCMDYSLGFPLGNLIENTFDYISEGPAKQRYRQMMIDCADGEIICRKCHRAMECIEK